MRILRNFIIKENIKFSSILKYFTLTLLIWMCYLKSDKLIFCSHLKIEYNVDRTLFASFNRLLAKHEIQEGLGSHRQRELLTDNIMNKNMKNALEHPSTYGQLNKSKNDLDSYMRGYKLRYSKKNGLGKLDCYCEKKVFDKIENIDKLIEKMQNDKKLLKKKLFHKFAILSILFSLIPVLGLIVPSVFYGYLKLNFDCFNNCSNSKHNKSDSSVHDDNRYNKAPIDKSTWETFSTVHFVLYCILSFIVISVIIYIIIKFIKYQTLKECKSKMSMKEYCNFCKGLFI
ncbi:Plasmodium exported protein, unknown function [Plasmodium vivax]|uniref:Variable surface protein n=1 Tax=Plasmodium vivax TaxID=5855 RepID=A0A565A5W0_PLAVI|nr:Plasmodium exported protein, unknown function [Plasmodium vivax]